MAASSIPVGKILQRVLEVLDKRGSETTSGEELLKSFADYINAGNQVAAPDINHAVKLLQARKFVEGQKQEAPTLYQFANLRITDDGRIALQALEMAGRAGSPGQTQESTGYRLWVAAGVTAGTLVILAVKLSLQGLYSSLKLDDSLTIGLLVVAVLPWASQLLSSVRLPGGWEFVFREIKEKQEKQGDLLLNQQEQIQALRTAVRGIVTKHEYDKLVWLNKNGPFPCKYSEDMFDELKRLRALNLVCNHEGTGLAHMAREHKGKDAEFDLKRYFFITEEGRNYLRMRGDADKEGS